MMSEAAAATSACIGFLECFSGLLLFLLYFQQQVKQLYQVGALQIGAEQVARPGFLLHFIKDLPGIPVLFAV